MVLATVAALGGGCGEEASGPQFTIRIHVPPSPSADRRCPETSSFVPLGLGPSGPTSLRVTYRDPDTGALQCDAVLATDGEAPSVAIGVPRGDAGAALSSDIVVEAFRTEGEDDRPELVASGEARRVVLTGAGEVPVLLAPRETFACAGGRLGVPRAFHTATPLPNGEVLIVGGIVPHPDPLHIDLGNPIGGGFYASAAVEIYDPRRGTFRELPVTDLLPRALHAGYLLSPPGPDGPFEILLLGGLTVSGSPTATPILDGVRDMVEPLRLVPTASAQAAPAEILTYDPRTSIGSRRAVPAGTFEARMFQAASPPPGPGDAVAATPPVVAGGWSAPGAVANTFELVEPTSGSRLGSSVALSPSVSRIGATVTHLGGDRAVVLGGNLSSPTMAEGTEIGHVLTGLSTGAATPAALAVDATAPPPPRAFHTAAALDADRVLVVGGFSVAGGTALAPTTPFAYVLTVPDGATATWNAVTADGAIPTGYAAIATILDGDLLVTGGSPEQDFPCPGGAMASYLCALDQAHRFDRALESFTPVDSLVVGRWGHRMAVLADGTVLVTGGFTWLGDLQVVPDAELWNPRTESDDPVSNDPAIAAGTITRAPGDVARDSAGRPARPCFVAP